MGTVHATEPSNYAAERREHDNDSGHIPQGADRLYQRRPRCVPPSAQSVAQIGGRELTVTLIIFVNVASYFSSLSVCVYLYITLSCQELRSEI